MVYSIKECFYTLQGEGAHSGRAAVFLRFSGCNLWNGIEEDRLNAICKFCDTDFIGTNGINGGKFSNPEELAKHAFSFWQGKGGIPYIVCTGGEPLLQLNDELIKALKKQGFEIAIESNGTIEAPKEIDWICISPKIGSTLVQTKGDELKLVFGQENCHPSQFENLDFKHFFLQPMYGDNYQQSLQETIKYCMDNPLWNLSLQTHKLIGIM